MPQPEPASPVPGPPAAATPDASSGAEGDAAASRAQSPGIHGAETEFRSAMSDFLRSMDRQQLEQASAALQQARRIQPEAPAVRDAALRLEAARRSSRLRQLEQLVHKAELSGQWQQARDAYEQMLRLDPGAAVAEAGRQRAAGRLRLSRALERYLKAPDLLQSDTELAKAKGLLDQLQSLPDAGGRLQAKQRQLQQQVSAAQRLWPVHIRSDELTEVTLLRVGRLGKFAATTLQLRPGTYTAVGTRKGFRDVRLVFILKAGVELELLLRCEERI